MPRIQILELPTVYRENGTDETPFVLVIDQYEPPAYPPDVNDPAPFAGVAEEIGARCVLVFEGTVEIPANDTSAYAAQPLSESRLEVHGELPKFGPPRDGEPLPGPDRIPGRYA